MTWDARYCCPECGRSALPPDYPMIYPAYTAEVWAQKLAGYYENLEARGGRLWGHRTAHCINDHSWTPPAEARENGETVQAEVDLDEPANMYG